MVFLEHHAGVGNVLWIDSDDLGPCPAQPFTTYVTLRPIIPIFFLSLCIYFVGEGAEGERESPVDPTLSA